MTKHSIRFAILSVSLALAYTAQAAGGRGGTVPPTAPAVTSASIEQGQRLLTIKGRSFGTEKPSVLLGDTALRVQQNTDNQILAELPAGMKTASYRLTVTGGPTMRVNSEPFFVTLLTDVK